MANRLLVATLAFLGLAGIGGGFALTTDTTGRSLGLPLEALEGSPFSSFLIPGLTLLVALGVFPLVVSLFVLRKAAWSWYGALLCGCMLLAWIAVEVAVVGYHADPPLQAMFAVLGVVIVLLALLPSVRSLVRRKGALEV